MKMSRPYISPESKTRLLLLAALFVSCLVIFNRYIFGNEVMVFNDVGGDTWQQYTMHYASIVNHLREGNFALWDFTNGFGTNMFNMNLFDPSLMLLYLLGVLLGPAHMLFYLVWIQIFKVLAAGWIFYWFLSEFSFGRQAKFLAAFAYGLSGYLLVWGQHYQFGMVTVYFPLILLFCEKYIRGKKWRALFPATIFLCGIYSVYFTYMSLVAAGFYLLFRVLMLEGLTKKERLKKFLAGCGQMLLGVGMSLAVFLPMANVLLNVSSRLEGEGTGLLAVLRECFTLYRPKYYENLLVRPFSTNLQNLQELGDGKYQGLWNYYEDPVLFCSTLAVFSNVQLLVLFWKTKASRRVKAGVYTAAVFMAAVLLLPLGGIAFNAFTAPTNRYTFVLIPFFLAGMAWLWDYLKMGGRISVAALAVVCFFMLRAYLQGYEQSVFQEYRTNAVILAVTGMIMALCLLVLLLIKKERPRQAVMGLLALALVVNVVSEGGITYEDRVSLRKEDTPLEEMEEQNALYAREGALEKSERQARAALSRPQDYFRALYRQDIQDALAWLEETDLEFYRVEKDFASATISMDALAQGYRGISTYNSVMNGNIKEFVDTCYPELYYMDHNRYTFWVNAGDNWFASFVGVRYLLSGDGGLDSSRYRLVKQFGGIYLYENVLESDMARFYENAISEESLKKLCREDSRAALLDSVIAVKEGEDITAVSEAEAMKGQPGHSPVTLDAPRKDSLVTGRVQAASDGYVMFMIPYEDGWQLTVDGEETELIRGDLGFLACRVTAGDHELKLAFHAPMLKEGLAASAVCWLGYGLWLILRRKKAGKAYSGK